MAIEKRPVASFETELDDEHLLGDDPKRSSDNTNELSAKMMDKQCKPTWRLLIGVVVVAIIALASTVGLVLSRSGKGQTKSSNSVVAHSLRNPTSAPSPSPTVAPTSHPSLMPTLWPSDSPTSVPSQTPSQAPSSFPPSPSPSALPTSIEQVTTYYAIGDVPYTDQQAVELNVQILNLPWDAEFLVHVGDLRAENENVLCLEKEYTNVATILRQSHAPVFVLLGDNDWNDCANRPDALAFWKQEFVGFASRYWNHSFDIMNHPERPENFAFVHKGTLFIGLDIVGGLVQSTFEWNTRLTDEVNWTKNLIRNYTIASSRRVGRVVLFGHADPTVHHAPFFDPLKFFIRDELHNRIPILYMNGDGHRWAYEPNYLGQPSFLRIMVIGKTTNPVLKVMVHANGAVAATQDAFVYDRRLGYF